MFRPAWRENERTNQGNPFHFLAPRPHAPALFGSRTLCEPSQVIDPTTILPRAGAHPEGHGLFVRPLHLPSQSNVQTVLQKTCLIEVENRDPGRWPMS